MAMRVVHYLNQFFGQIGGEDQAGIEPMLKDGPVGCGNLLQNNSNGELQVVGTVICGDNYFMENEKQATGQILDYIASYNPDLVVAGPAFNAGRYGPACGAVCHKVQEKMGIPTVTGMFPENPGVEIYRKTIYCVETASSASGMAQSMPKLAELALRLARGESPTPQEGGYIPRGIRSNRWSDKKGASRAVDMLLAKMKEQPFQTEIPITQFDRVDIPAPVKDLSSVKIALVTEGGLVRKGNPDRLESSKASGFYEYSLQNIDDLTEEQFQSVHGGYNTFFVNKDPDRLLPVDILRELEGDGVIGELHDSFYTTTGNQTTLENGQKFGREIALRLQQAGVEAVILVST